MVFFSLILGLLNEIKLNINLKLSKIKELKAQDFSL